MGSREIVDFSEFAVLVEKVSVKNLSADPEEEASPTAIEKASRGSISNHIVKQYVLKFLLIPRLVDMKRRKRVILEIDGLIRWFVDICCIFIRISTS